MMDTLPDEDLRLFKILTDHPLADSEELAKQLGHDGKRAAVVSRIGIQRFCERYRCIERAQILQYERMGLSPFFVLSRTPIDPNAGVVRQFQMFGTHREYLTLCVTSNLDRALSRYETSFSDVRIFPPTNSVRLLQPDPLRISFNDEWLLNLKEVMVDQELGEIVGPHDVETPKTPIPVTEDLLAQLGQIYLNDQPRRLFVKELDFIREHPGFISSYFDLTLPNMADYILILQKMRNPRLFMGGFIGYFPLAELYLAPEALICRFKIPELSFPKMNLSLFMHLREVCHPALWMLLEDRRFFPLPALWEQGQWKRV
jgi:hypothetical protein